MAAPAMSSHCDTIGCEHFAAQRFELKRHSLHEPQDNLYPMPSIAISTATAEEASDIGANLRQFNRTAIGNYDIQPIRLRARMPEGRIVGGLNGHFMMQWLGVGVIWIAEDVRGQGIGSRLLLQAESSARALGAQGAYLDTFEWQAAPFYMKHGYAEFGRLNDFPLGSYRLFMSKHF